MAPDWVPAARLVGGGPKAASQMAYQTPKKARPQASLVARPGTPDPAADSGQKMRQQLARATVWATMACGHSAPDQIASCHQGLYTHSSQSSRVSRSGSTRARFRQTAGRVDLGQPRQLDHRQWDPESLPDMVAEPESFKTNLHQTVIVAKDETPVWPEVARRGEDLSHQRRDPEAMRGATQNRVPRDRGRCRGRSRPDSRKVPEPDLGVCPDNVQG